MNGKKKVLMGESSPASAISSLNKELFCCGMLEAQEYQPVFYAREL